jgi:hypothetical protein
MGKVKEMYNAMINGEVEDLVDLMNCEKSYGEDLDDKIHQLASEYQILISGDHHKDRDCHWSITRKWAYGEDIGWVVEHIGYLYEAVEIFCESYREAQETLIDTLVLAISQQSKFNLQDLEPYDDDEYDRIGV